MFWVLLRGDFCEYPQHTFLWRNKQNYLLIITKYPPYLFHCSLFVKILLKAFFSIFEAVNNHKRQNRSVGETISDL